MLTVSRKVFDGCNPVALPQLTWISQVARSSGDHRIGVTADGSWHQDVKPGMPEHDLRIVRRTAGVDRPPIQGTASRTDPSRRTPDLEIVGSRSEGWLKLVASFHTKRGGLRRAIGRPASLEAEAAKRGQRWIQGIALSREIFGQTSGERPPEAN